MEETLQLMLGVFCWQTCFWPSPLSSTPPSPHPVNLSVTQQPWTISGICCSSVRLPAAKCPSSKHKHPVCNDNFPVAAVELPFVFAARKGEVVNSLVFAWHRLSPLAAFTSSAYFLHSGRQWQWICKFYTANFKGIFWWPIVRMCLATSNNLLLML